MRLRLQSLLFFFLLSTQLLFAQNAEYRVIQSVSNDTLYVDFEIRRSSVTPYDLAGYNLSFNIDTALLDTVDFELIDQGAFGALPGKFRSTELHDLNGRGRYQVTLMPMGSPSTTVSLPSTFTKAGKVAFLIKQCGISNITFNKSNPATVIGAITTAGDVETIATEIPTAGQILAGSANAQLTISKDTVCKNGLVNISVQPSTFSQYTLFENTTTGPKQIGNAQASNAFNGIAITSSSSYFVRFQIGSNTACQDVTPSKSIVTEDPPAKLSITPITGAICLGQTLPFGSSINNATDKIIWRLFPSTLAQFVGPSSGRGLNNITVDFQGTNPYTVKLVVQDTTKYGCASLADTITLSPVKCDLNPDFAINGSATSTNSCQNKFVTYTDNSTSSSGIKKWSWNFGPGAIPDTFNLQNPPAVKYTASGLVNVSLTVTDNNGLTRSITKSPTVKILSILSGIPAPSCGSSSCREVNFNWQHIPEATEYRVRYRKGLKGSFTPFQSIGTQSNFTVTNTSFGMGGSLEYSDTANDSVYFQVYAFAGICDSIRSPVVFCKPSFCSTVPNCKLPGLSIPTPPTACIGSTVRIKVTTTPQDYYNYPDFQTVRFVWENGGFDTLHYHDVKINTEGFQKVKLLTSDTALANCYSLNFISIPVGKTLTTKPDLGIQSLECDRVTFVWKHVEGALKYQIKYTGSCLSNQDVYVDAPLNGQAEFFDLAGLTNGCKVNFQVKAVGSCNSTESDTLISPPTCTCFIGHIASSNVKSCALDTLTLKVSNIQVPNWKITWFDPVKNISVSSTTDSTYKFVPDQPDKIYAIKYNIYDLSKTDSCITTGYVYDTTKSSTSPEWNPVRQNFCISDVIYYLGDKSLNPGYKYSGRGITTRKDEYYFDSKLAGLGRHTITYNACGNLESHDVTIVDKPCVTTVVGGGGLIKNPKDLYTACDGTIFITDEVGIWKYSPGGISGIPELIVKSTGNDIDGNLSSASFGRPYGIVLDESTKNELYFADQEKYKIKRIIFDKSRMETVAGVNVPGNRPDNNTPESTLLAARFTSPFGLAIHPNSDTLYVSDIGTNSIKSFTFKTPNPKVKLVLGNFSGTDLPGRGKSVYVHPRRIAVDSFGLSFTDDDGFIGRYSFKSDSAKASTIPSSAGYKDGFPSQYLVREIAGVTPRLGDWVYFTDKRNYALRRINVNNGYMETVAGSPPQNGQANPLPTGANGPALESRFTLPSALSFNIKGYIDILDEGNPVSVRRYFIPRWGIGTWDRFDTTYVVNCDSDTINPGVNAGILRVVKGDPTAVSANSIFTPKLTGTYLLSYKIQVGRCDTVFYRTVVVRDQPKPILKGDTTCEPSYTFRALAGVDNTIKYKWFGPDIRTLALPDSGLTANVTKSGKYWVEIYFGKGNKCLKVDSAIVKFLKSQIGIINTTSPKSGPSEATVCFGGNVPLSMDEGSPTAPKFKSFQWSTGANTKTIVASGSANYSATAVDSLGCNITARFRVIQNPLSGICIKASDAATGQSLGWGSYKVSTFAGKPGVQGQVSGKGSNATFKFPWGLTIHNDTLFVSDKNNKIRSITLNDATVADYLGTGTNTVVDSVDKSKIAFNTPQGFRFDKAGNLYVANTGSSNIAKYDKAKNLYYILAGSGNTSYTDSIGKLADLNQPYDLELDAAGNIYFTDNQNHAIRTIDFNGKVRTLAGTPPNFGNADGKGTQSSFNWPWGITMLPSGELIVAEDANHTIRRIGLDTNVALVGGIFKSIGNNSSSIGKAVPGLSASFNRPWNLSSDVAGNVFFTDSGNNLLRLLNNKGEVITIAGTQGVAGTKDGKADTATFSNITGVVVDPKTQSIYVADQNNHTIRKLTKNKIVYFCKGSTYNLTDSCSGNRTDLSVSWKIKQANGSFTPLLLPPSQRAEPATYIMEVKYNGVCTNVLSDTVDVRYHEVDSSFSIIEPLGVGGLISICRKDSLTFKATPGYPLYQWGIRQGITEDILGTTTTNTFKTAFNTSFFGNVFLKVKNKNTGCMDRAKSERPLFVQERLIANFLDSLTCLGNLTQLYPVDSDPSQTTYLWNFGDLSTLADTSDKNPGTYLYPKSGEFNVTLIANDNNKLSCSDTVIKKVTISSLPKLTLTLNNSLTDTTKICLGVTPAINLKANFTPDANTAAPFTYQWQDLSAATGTINTSVLTATNSATPVLGSGLNSELFGYSVFVRDAQNCESNRDSAFVSLTLTPKFQVDVSTDKLCLGQSLTLSATDLNTPASKPLENSYKWFFAGKQINTDITSSSYSFVPELTGTYTLVVRNIISGCTASFTTVKVDVVGFSYKINAVTPAKPCADPDQVPVNSTLIKGNPISPVTFLWTDSATNTSSSAISDPNSQNITVFRDSTRTLILLVKDFTGCTSSDTVTIKGTSSKVPVFEAILSATKICRGQNITVSGRDLLLNPPQPQKYSYKWDSAGVRIKSDITKPVLVNMPFNSVVYKLTVEDLQNNCISTASTSELEVTGFDLTIDPVQDPVPCSATDQVQLSPNLIGTAVQPFETIRWTDSAGLKPQSIDQPNILSPKSFRDSSRVYKLFVKDAAGCYDSSYVKVKGTSLVKPKFSVSLSPKSSICRGDEITLTPFDTTQSSPDQFYYFYDSLGIRANRDTTQAILKKSPQADVSYTLTVKSKNSGCAVTLNPAAIQVSGFTVGIDSIIQATDCTPSTSATLSARIKVGNALQPYKLVQWTDLNGKVPTSIDRPDQFIVSTTRDSTRIYKFSLTDASNCQASTTIRVKGSSTIKPKFKVVASEPGPICKGKSVTFTAVDQNNPQAPSQYTYFWDSAGTVVASGTKDVFVSSPKVTTKYSLRVKSINSGCDTTIGIQDIVVNGFDVSFKFDKRLECVADSAPLQGIVTTSNIKNIQWLDATTGLASSSLYPPNSLNVMVFRDFTREYSLTVTDINDCQQTGNITIQANSFTEPEFIVATGKDTGVCINSKVKFRLAVTKGIAPYKFTWKDGQNNSVPEVDFSDALNPVISASSSAGTTKNYIISMQDDLACFDPVSQSVSVKTSDLTLRIDGTTNKLCRTSSDPNPSTDLIAIQNATTPVFEWKNLNTGKIASTDVTLGSINSSGTYQVEVKDEFSGCVRKASKDIQLMNSPKNAMLTANMFRDILCNNLPINLYATFNSGMVQSARDSIDYTWKVFNGLNGLSAKDSSATYIPAVADTNVITFKVIAFNRCDVDSSEVKTQKLKPGPVAKVFTSVLETRTNKDVTYTNGTINSDSANILILEDGFSTSLGSGSGQTFNQVYLKEGRFKTILYSINKNGCSSEDSVFVTVIDKQNIFVPNVFSPNASQEENKTFRIFAQNLSNQDFSLSVYDRWGHLVFITTDVNKAMFVGWDGKDSGNDSQLGVYTYALKARFNDGTVVEKTGTITLLR